MKWSRPRFSVLQLMVAIASLALVFGTISCVAEMRARSDAYRRRASEFAMSTLRRSHDVPLPDGRWVDNFDTENDLLHDAWKWRMAAKYLRLSYYPWLAAEPDPPRPVPLAHPRKALELPAQDNSVKKSVVDSRPPVWTFVWTWRWQGLPFWQ